MLYSLDLRRSRGGDQSLWATVRPRRTLILEVSLLLLAASMLVAGVGDAGLWIAVVAVGVALVVIDLSRSRHA